MIGVVDEAEIAEVHHHRVEIAFQPVALELLELGPEVVEGIVGRVHLVDEAGVAQLHDVLAVRENDVVGAGRRLVDEGEHLLAADIFLADDLDAVLLLEGLDDEGVGMARPAQISERVFLRAGPAAGEGAGERRRAGECRCTLHESAPRQAPAARVTVPHAAHNVLLPYLFSGHCSRTGLSPPPSRRGLPHRAPREKSSAATRARARLFGPGLRHRHRPGPRGGVSRLPVDLDLRGLWLGRGDSGRLDSGRDRADDGRHRAHADAGAHAGLRRHDRDDPAGALGRPLRARHRAVGAAGDRGLARGRLRQASRAAAGIRLDRAPHRGAGGAGRPRGHALRPCPISARMPPGSASR